MPWNQMYLATRKLYYYYTNNYTKTYFGPCDHNIYSFRKERYENVIELSKHTWSLKDRKFDSLRSVVLLSITTSNGVRWKKSYLLFERYKEI